MCELDGCRADQLERKNSWMTVAEQSITEKRDLRTGTPVWAAYRQSPIATQVLLAPLKTELLIVGAGITGALLAEAASAKGLSTILIDRRPPGHGSTAASTALLQFEIDTPLIHLAADIGLETASRIWRRSFRAVQDLVHLVQRLQVPCDFADRRALYLAGNRLNAAEIEEEGRLRRGAGLPSPFLTHTDLVGMTGIDREAALLSQGSAEVNPVQLTAGLLSRALSRGCRVFAPAELAEVVASSSKVAMVTTEGVEMEAKTLVFATGYELADGVPAAGHRRTSTWAFATPPQPRAIWGSAELIWEASDPLSLHPQHQRRARGGRRRGRRCDGRGDARCPAAQQGGNSAKEDQGLAAVARCDGRFRLGRYVRRKREWSAVDRRPSRYAELLRRAGLRR